MGKGGRKYRLLMYEYMLNRWWPMTMLTAFVLFLYVGLAWGAEQYFVKPTENPVPPLSATGRMVLLAVGLICLLFSLFLLMIRKLAYIQLFDDHLCMVTPFLRMNLSYKRISRTFPSQLHDLFPRKSLSSWKRDLIEPIWGRTVVVMHLTSYPLSRPILRLFLSPFFFHDRSSHFVLLIDDWMQFSAELDSRRSLLNVPTRHKPTQEPPRRSVLLDDLLRK